MTDPNISRAMLNKFIKIADGRMDSLLALLEGYFTVDDRPEETASDK